MINSLFKPQKILKELTTGEIDIWYASLERPVTEFNSLLSEEEKKRAERFRFEKDRRYFIVCHGILRLLLSDYLDIEPSQIRFCYEKNGKPKLADASGDRNIYFNLSHSEGVAVYAFTRDSEIGVDIERIHDIADMMKIAERYFSIRENVMLRNLPRSQKKQAFFYGWTRKEAFIKANGNGLSYPLDGFDVSLIPGEPAKLLAIGGDIRIASEWAIHDLKPGDDYAGAVAVRGQIRDVHYWQWNS